MIQFLKELVIGAIGIAAIITLFLAFAGALGEVAQIIVFGVLFAVVSWSLGRAILYDMKDSE